MTVTEIENDLSRFEIFMKRFDLNDEEMAELLEKYEATHGCRCSSYTCDGHRVCHNSVS